MSASEPEEVAPPLTLKHSPAATSVIVPLELTVHCCAPLQVKTSAVAFGAVEPPLTLRHRPEPLEIVPSEFTVQFCAPLPSQVAMSAVLFGAVDSPVTLRQSPE